jgi:hypothetical protein
VEALLVERLALLGEVDVAREIRRSELLEGPLVHQAGGVGGGVASAEITSTTNRWVEERSSEEDPAT